MCRILICLIFCLLQLSAWASEPYCNVTTYSYGDGLPSSTGSRVIQDQHGYIWIATWNGLYRFDGYEFSPIRPGIDNEVRKYSSRFRDIKMGPDGKMWCRIDDNIVLFDVDSYEFTDLQSALEKSLGEKIKIENAIRESAEGDVVLAATDGRHLLFDAGVLRKSGDAVAALKMVKAGESVRFKSGSFHKAPLPSGFSKKDVAYSIKDASGRIWIIVKDGRILTTPGDGEPVTEVTSIDVGGSAVKFSCQDTQGHLWMVSNAGVHKISLGSSPLAYFTPPAPSQLRASMADARGRIWMSWSDAEYVCVYDSLGGSPRYLAPDGSLSASPVAFGSPVYTMVESAAGQIWLGSKPDGLFRLTPRDVGYTVDHFRRPSADDPDGQMDNYYDAVFDSRGRLWLATLGNGVEVIENPAASLPEIFSLRLRSNYPVEADKVRRLRIIGDSLIVATTTEGLLSFPMPDNAGNGDMAFSLHRSVPGDPHTLGNIATMDAVVGSDGRLYVATESDGINIVTSPLSAADGAKWQFRAIPSDYPALSETTLTLSPLSDGRILAVGKKDINVIDPSGEQDMLVLGRSFWKKDPVFKEVSPLQMPDGKLLIGLGDGAVSVNLDRNISAGLYYPVDFTSYNIEGGPSIPLSPGTDTIVLQSHERAMTLSFAALCYSDAEGIRYAYRLDDDKDWTSLATLRTLTLTRLAPGTHKISVRSTDHAGRWLDNSRTITIRVTPTFWETGWAKLLYVVVALSLIGVVVWIWIYMRRIKRKQRETLEAYMGLLESRASRSLGDDVIPETPEPDTPALDVAISDEDKAIISKVVDFIDRNFSDSSISVDDMAAAVSISRSGLTRKMKSLMGVTPADFLKTTRLSKSKVMLKESSASIKEIALDCGFSDMNYFGKCFKSAFGMSPGAFRKEN